MTCLLLKRRGGTKTLETKQTLAKSEPLEVRQALAVLSNEPNTP
jgi:hypothetical protein